MLRKLKLMVACCCLAVASTATYATPLTWNFVGNGLNLGKDEVFTDTTASKSLTATAINTEEPPGAVLYQGFVIPFVGASNAGLGVQTGTEINVEVDNQFDDEGIVFDFGSVFNLESIVLANLGVNLGIFGVYPETYEVWGTNSSSVVGCTSGGLPCLTGPSTLLASGSVGNQSAFSVDLTGNSFRYVIATIPPGGGNDSLRVNSLTASSIPEPSAIALLLMGLIGLGASRKMKKSP